MSPPLRYSWTSDGRVFEDLFPFSRSSSTSAIGADSGHEFDDRDERVLSRWLALAPLELLDADRPMPLPPLPPLPAVDLVLALNLSFSCA
mmetsp:Transcript_2053/g.3790  ORF Transcript_2053/g.3790 Transcript_2053/m.3790 type:complete len:90 (+) Transcript_2053:75-344(+)